MAGKVESKKLEEYENENYYLLWWSETAHALSPKMAGILILLFLRSFDIDFR